jgi:hypothetical protein
MLLADPARALPVAVALLILALILWWFQRGPEHSPAERPLPPPPAAGSDQPGEYLFCFWNVENLFDDREDRRPPKDRPYDEWFAHDAAARTLKLRHLSEALLRLNGGRGPDILACAEVESVRAAELLRDALNAGLADPDLHYRTVLMKDLNAGRHIATAIITRLPVRAADTRLLGSKLRILEGCINVNGHDLTIIASHWTSQLTDEEGEKR